MPKDTQSPGASRLRDTAGLGLIEVMVALILFAVGMLAVAGIGLQVAAQNRWSDWQTDETLAAQEILERVQRAGYATASSGSDTVTVGHTTYRVTRTVTQLANRVRQVQVTVATAGGARSRTFTSRLYEPRQLPAAP
jgi:Tfp pilus assembly protein PilV